MKCTHQIGFSDFPKKDACRVVVQRHLVIQRNSGFAVLAIPMALFLRRQGNKAFCQIENKTFPIDIVTDRKVKKSDAKLPPSTV